LFSNHVQVILDRKATLDSIAQQLVSIPTALRADDIRAEYDEQYVRALAMASGFRTALLATAAVLLGCTIYILAKWRRATAALRFQASHDALTGLANRALLQHRLAQATQSAQRDGSSLALLLMDLDRFKEVNDTLGHHAGDQLLQAVAQRLGDTVRTTDTVARLGGDEFAVLLPGADEQAAIGVARKLLRRLEEPCIIDGYAIDLEASAGIAVAPSHGYEPHAMLRRADVAMYIAKAGHTGYAVYTPDQDVNNTDRLGKVAELRQAIEGGQLILHYQPKLDCRTDQFSGVEALVRWQHPERGLIPPDQFIPLAEQTELIYPLTRWVLEEALRQCSGWRMRGLHVPIAINLSVRSLQDPHLPEMIADLLATWSISPRLLTLEVTESAVMADPQKALAVLEHLRATGVRVAIDDFGTGYSSLAYLKQIPADDLKIDRSFTMSMLTDPTGQAIVRSTIELGHSLGLRVIAEGIEDDATYRALSNLNCDEGQGYYIARPLPREQLIAWLQVRSHVTDAAA
jgi:diguanylate cyclase (GGDEF)-like protein